MKMRYDILIDESTGSKMFFNVDYINTYDGTFNLFKKADRGNSTQLIYSESQMNIKRVLIEPSIDLDNVDIDRAINMDYVSENMHNKLAKRVE